MTLSIINGSVVMLSVIYAECRKQTYCAECHYAECRYAECVVVPFKGRSDHTQHERQHSVSNDVVPSVPFLF
jgi:hypothetical protein